jgi:2-polyprenyl-3-methyl-5-hydroxy-6-metoxy-1,4-benzoquinol methylase
MDNLYCILCNSSNIITTESLNTDQITTLYNKRASVDVNRFFEEKTISYCTCADCGLHFYWPQAVGDGAFYDDLQEYKGYYLPEKSEYHEAAKFINPSDSILEIGCGEGLFTDFIKYKGYTGLEFSDNAIAKATQKGLTVLKESLETHANKNVEKYDAVCYFQVLEHVKNPGSFIKESLQCLKHGGRLIIAVPSEDSFIHDVVNFYLNMPPHHTSRWTDQTLKRIADLFKLEVESVFHEPLQPIHKVFYKKTVIHKKLSGFIGRKFRILDDSAVNIFLDGVSVLTAKAAAPFVAKQNNITGQSVLFIYKKL